MNIKDKPAFRRIEPDVCGTWSGYAGTEFRARFWYASDAIEWRANDPLNKGTIDELLEREEWRNKPD